MKDEVGIQDHGPCVRRGVEMIAHTRVTAPIKGIVTMVCGAALLTGNDAASKYLAESYPVGQVICLRQAATLFVIVPYVMLATGWSALRVTARAGQLARGLLFSASAVLMVTSLSLLPLATVSAIAFSSPIFVALFSAPMLGERVSFPRWIAILIGFAGVLVAIQPTAESFEWVLLIPVGTALANGLRDIVTRRLSRSETSISILFWSSVVVMLAGLTTAPFGWQPLTATAVGWFFVAGLFNAGAHFLMIEALRLGAAAVVAPFRYTGLVWAVLIGFVIWSDLPDVWVVVGGLIIIAGGVQMMRLEARGS
jgi:drug/metabolite transporter (DMT)-like permease